MQNKITGTPAKETVQAAKKERRDKDMKTIAQRIRSEREKRGFTQEDMARYLGVTAANYSDLERGKRNITLDNFLIIVGALKCSPDALLESTMFAVKDLPRMDRIDGEILHDLERCKFEVVEITEDDGSVSYELYYRDGKEIYKVSVSLNDLVDLREDCLFDTEAKFRPIMTQYFRELFLRRILQRKK